MPSYYRDRRKRFQSRYEILSALRDKKLRWKKVEDIFNQTIGRLLPGPKLKAYTPGYSEATVTLPTKKFSLKSFRQLLLRLKKDGFILQSTELDDRTLQITKQGLDWLKKFTEQPRLVAPDYVVTIEKSDRVTIISYDIPEQLRLYRDWLRIVLRAMHFNKIQQSVWVGKAKLPQEFIADIVRYELESYVEIFEITKSGTLRSRL